MLNPNIKYGKIEDNLEQIASCIFAEELNPSKFFPLLMHIADDPDLSEPANIIFAMYNLLIREQPQTAYNGLNKVKTTNPNSLANVTGHVIISAYLAYTKKYKQSLQTLSFAIDLCEQSNLDRQFSSFYRYCIMRMIQIFDFATFKRQYINLMQKILKKYQSNIEDNQILKMIARQRDTLQQNVCTIKKRTNFADFANLSKRSSKLKQMKLDGNLNIGAGKNEREKSLSSSKKSNPYSTFSKRFNKEEPKKKFINPYGLVYKQQRVKNQCVFM